MRSRYVTRQIWVRGARALVFTRTSTLLHGQRNANGTLVSTLEPRRRSPIPRMVLISFLIRPADSSLTTGFFFVSGNVGGVCSQDQVILDALIVRAMQLRLITRVFLHAPRHGSPARRHRATHCYNHGSRQAPWFRSRG